MSPTAGEAARLTALRRRLQARRARAAAEAADHNTPAWPAPAAPDAAVGGDESSGLIGRILARRTQRLADVPAATEAGAHLTLLVVRMGPALYALEGRQVAEIRPAARITPLPRVPGWVAGLVNLHGHILPVISLEAFWNLVPPGRPAGARPGTAALVVTAGPGLELALLVDEVLGIESWPVAAIAPAGQALGDLPREHLHGVIARPSGEPALTTVLNLPAILADERLVVDEPRN